MEGLNEWECQEREEIVLHKEEGLMEAEGGLRERRGNHQRTRKVVNSYIKWGIIIICLLNKRLFFFGKHK